MNSRIFWVIILPVIFILLDFYVFLAVKSACMNLSANSRKIIYIIYWTVVGLTWTGMILFLVLGVHGVSNTFRTIFFSWMFGFFIAKILIAIFLLGDDIRRLIEWISGMFSKENLPAGDEGRNIPRSQFISKIGLIAGTLPFIAMAYGVISGAYNYRIHHAKLKLKNLPSSFDGLTIAQISDIHAGSFYDKEAVMRGVQMILDQKPDVIFFTGDLVNNEAVEMKNYIDVFSKLKA
ncbi:MAG: metallophosphoesterase, partial [Cytophagaceae bacterium]|nr:metallophosphoesterase [Cytophagaceae bacterium]